MVEPSRTDARVRLAWTPHITALQTVVQLLVWHVSLVVQQTPVRLTDKAGLCAHPAQVATVAAVVPYQAFGLQLANHAVGLRPLIIGCTVYLAHLVGSAIPSVTAVGTVEPHLEHITVLRQQLAQLVAEVSHVGRLAVFRMISVPRREIDGIFQSLFLAGLG